jgi:hypothetical protein
MLEKDIYNKIIQFIKKCINDNSVTILIGNQNAPNAIKPFITVTISSINQLGQVIKHEPRFDELLGNVQDFTYVRNAYIQVQSFCNDIFQPASLLEKIRMGFDIDSSYSVFGKEIAFVRDLSDIIILPTQLSANQEYRAAYDFVLCYNQTITNKIDYVTHVEITNEVNDDKIIVDKSVHVVYNSDSTEYSFYTTQENDEE